MGSHADNFLEMQPYRRVGEWMLAKGILTQDQLTEALSMRSTHQCRFGDLLVAEGFCTEQDVIDCLAAQFDLPVIDLGKVRPRRDALRLISGSFALNRLLLPVRYQDGFLDCVVADPVDIESTDALRGKSFAPLKIFLATSTQLRTAIQKAYKLPTYDSKAVTAVPTLKIDAQVDRRALLMAMESGGLAA